MALRHHQNRLDSLPADGCQILRDNRFQRQAEVHFSIPYESHHASLRAVQESDLDLGKSIKVGLETLRERGGRGW